ncbi:NADH dehydrogenase subunit 4 [Prochlorococcus marinus str. SS51]|uniref:NAD(P)H-quinone oxidoreductase chain 4 n=1 Tax=Prochlorococcus marinus (strain SARG / CCMP1375 / SS120) TaxID=167539 RepID=NU4C_PROMA|nr:MULTISPECIES: NAD(P)H-quinone oxidoreductase subunit 4 [Prochlorococcus]Q7VE41.1 RecName: Full=NAD(P)H-quinone oxidoreductase chain 4; AltName: Full=NAD(P)H dehydrogenase I, chain 4; AltName: Full=NDH-1, chain 4 [Prochlorococcus marinus subsp. marinus str. CCMP1375]AAP99219.1 NAD(P)H-quinone oxidoreductase chain 4 [Prochlorococcus marinus subsp. marinus str. CCMP1375]KGG11513.1 NADH dehydrogenase subunit 4 [Prochlorococcus marinus str. LG]KGG18533.1 NADH dehydrogenase subunit 4 [Prochlorococ
MFDCEPVSLLITIPGQVPEPIAADFPWLSLSILFPIAGSLLVPFIPDEGEGKQVRWYALFIALTTFLITVGAYLKGFEPAEEGLQLSERVPWLPDLGLTWAVGADGLSMPLILLTSFITALAVLAAWPVSFKPKLFFFLILAMDGGQIAVFAVQDMLLFFLAWELELLPVYLLLAIWGGKKRQYAATKFIIYTAGSSLFILLAGLAMGFFGGGAPNFEFTHLANQQFGTGFQLLCYGGLLIAFGVKLPIVPLHTWLPDAHGEATAPVHMLLAGILLKMGGYALLRFNAQLLPAAHAQFAPLLIVLGVVNIIYAALTSFAQRNLKRKIAYSSISHMGFVLIGIGSFSTLGTSGAMLQMISHGLIGASLFFLVGATYDRTHTLQLNEMGGVGQKMRIMFALWTVCSLASLALPGMSGFVSELMVFAGLVTDEVYTLPFRIVIAGLAAIGVILTPIYLLSMLREIFFGQENVDLLAKRELVDAEPREIYIIGSLLVPIIGIGLYPRIMTETYTASIDGLVARDKLSIERVINTSSSEFSNQNISISNGQAPNLNIYSSSK